MSGFFRCFFCGVVFAGMLALSACGDGGASDDTIGLDFLHGFDINYGDIPVGYDVKSDIPVVGQCTGDDNCPREKPHCLIARGECVECIQHSHCMGRGFCLEGFVCGVTECQPDEAICVKNVAKVCNEDGSKQTVTDCGEDKYCVEGACYACPPLLGDCPSEKVARRCKADGSGWEEETCGNGLTCANGDCLSCIPGETICDGSTKVRKCTMDGSGFQEHVDCWDAHEGDICHMGQCINLCEFTSKFYTNKGCEYYAVDMEQFADSDPPYYGEDALFAIVVSNTFEALDARVVVYHGDTPVKTLNAPAGLATIINLEPLNINGVGITDKTYHVKSNLPIVAYQFNPLENVEVFSNDASLLLPTNVLGRSYRVMAMPSTGMNGAGQFLTGLITIVGVEEGDTLIKVTPTTSLFAGDGIPAIAKNATGEFTLKKGQVANLKTDYVAYSDLTGTLVEADKKIAVFSGHTCAYAPVSTCAAGKCSFDKSVSCSTQASCPWVMACDHLEEQIQPLAAWGKEYVIPKSKSRGKAPDLVRVVANEANTRVTITPPIAGTKVLGPGEYYEFEIDRSVVVKSDNQFLAAFVLEGEDAPGSAHEICINSTLDDFCHNGSGFGCMCTINDGSSVGSESCKVNADCSPDDANVGDPSLIMAVPVEQYRDFYIFLVPTKYAYSYISVVAPTGANVKIDGTALAASEFTAISGSGFGTADKHMNPGSHTLESDKPVGLYVYGWDSYVSYGYPGGMMLIKLAGDI